MSDAKTFGIFDFLTEFGVVLPKINEGVEIACVGLLKLVTDIAGVRFFFHPCGNGVSHAAVCGFLCKNRRLCAGLIGVHDFEIGRAHV